MRHKSDSPSQPDIRPLSPAELDHVSGGVDGPGLFAGVAHIQAQTPSLKLMGEILSNVSRTRAEISMTFARNARA